jgi:hypothetical protein
MLMAQMIAFALSEADLLAREANLKARAQVIELAQF